jgi:hypothetical protein
MVTKSEIADFCIEHISSQPDDMTCSQLLKYLINFYLSENDKILMDRILKYILEKTKYMFTPDGLYIDSVEYQEVSTFWSRCEENHVDELFPALTSEIIISCISQVDHDINYQYRKCVLEYCLKQSTLSQKKRIISEVQNDIANNPLAVPEKRVITQFLASLGDENSIKSILDDYLRGGDLHTREIFSMNSFGTLEKSDLLLDKYIKLLFYSTDIPDDGHYIRRENLIYLARNGIQQHLRQENFKSFESKMNKQITNLRKNNKYTEFYEEFLLQMEQLVYSQ